MHRRKVLCNLGIASISAASLAVRFAGDAGAEPPNRANAKPWLRKSLKIDMVGVKGSLEYQFRVVKAAGFEGIEVNVPGIDVDQVNAASKASGLIVDGSVGATHWAVRHTDPDASVRDTALANLKQGIEETAAVGGDSCLLVAGHGNDGTADEVHRRAVENIKAAIPTAEKFKVAILIENVWNKFLYDHDGGSDQSAQPLADFIDEFDSPYVGLQFDLGNHWKYGDIAQWVRTLGPRIKKLDIKGFSRSTDRFTNITEGDIDWKSIEQALRDIGFTGWCAAEVGGGGAKRLKQVADNMDAALHCSVGAAN